MLASIIYYNNVTAGNMVSFQLGRADDHEAGTISLQLLVSCCGRDLLQGKSYHCKAGDYKRIFFCN